MTKEKFDLICWAWIVLGILIVPLLLKVKQPYGRHTEQNWGPMINNRAGWIIMELPALLIVAGFVLFAKSENLLMVVAGILWSIHYVHRSIIFPFRLKSKGKKMPVVIMLFAILFNTVNGYLNGYWLANYSGNEVMSTGVMWRMGIGVVIFLTGYVINQYHDALLIGLRKKSGSGYSIPFGGLFRYVSCPNFLGEIITWLGFFVVTGSLPAFSFLVWTMVNLVPRALDHHKWYQEKFPDYPKERKAIIPNLI